MLRMQADVTLQHRLPFMNTLIIHQVLQQDFALRILQI